jgi:hypothetical protein
MSLLILGSTTLRVDPIAIEPPTKIGTIPALCALNVSLGTLFLAKEKDVAIIDAHSGTLLQIHEQVRCCLLACYSP